MHYIDLGLPSGTLWADTNEKDLYTFDDAINKFSYKLPTKDQWEELKSKCTWVWKDNGFNVIGSNGNSIFLPAKGYCYNGSIFSVGFNGSYWSSTVFNLDYIWYLDFYPDKLCMGSSYRYYDQSVRLIKNNNNKIETNMKENELTIEIPDGKIVDWDESKKQNKIVLKNKQLTYNDICGKLFKNEYFYIGATGNICSSSILDSRYYCVNNATTEHQLECILAKNKLATVAKYLNDGWKPSKTNGQLDAWVLFVTPNKDFIGYIKIDDCAQNSNVLFKSKELTLQAIEILGEETVKLALEPLGL